MKWSKGSRHDWQTHSDLHAVEPKRLDSRVSRLPHWGQRTDRPTDTGPETSRVGCGGAMPYAASLASPSPVIWSVDQAGDSTNSTSTCWNPASVSRSTTSSAMASIAGQPE